MDNGFETEDPDFDRPGSDDAAARAELERLEALFNAPSADVEREFVTGPRTKPRHGGSILMAAMLGLAEALGWDPEPTEITQPADPGSGPDFDLDFGDLPPLDEI